MSSEFNSLLTLGLVGLALSDIGSFWELQDRGEKGQSGQGWKRPAVGWNSVFASYLSLWQLLQILFLEAIAHNC